MIGRERMFIDINELEAGGTSFDRRLHLPDLGRPGEELLGVLEARLSGSVRPGPRGVDFRARLVTRLRLQCCRCLEPYETLLDRRFSLVLVAAAVEFGSDEGEMDAEQALLYHAQEGRADLREIAREQIFLHLPQKPLCTVGCRGLCPACGVNRNRIECGCGSEEIDPRLAPLLELRKRLGES